jgi:DNA-directed RNA polymerase specialized sigma24 family protein
MATKRKPKPKQSTPEQGGMDWLPIYNECQSWCEANFQDKCEDVMQQVFLNLSSSAIIPDNPIGYFRTCAYNEYLSQVKPRPQLYIVEVETDKILIEEVLMTIQHLKEFDRMVFKLHLIDGLPILRIARLTHIPVSQLYESLRISKEFVRSNFTP